MELIQLVLVFLLVFDLSKGVNVEYRSNFTLLKNSQGYFPTSFAIQQKSGLFR